MKPHLPTPVPRPLALSLRLIGARRAVFPALAAIPGLVFADLPTGGTVVGGAATIANVAANHQQITQTTDRTIINWQTFSIDGASYVHFIQPSSSSVVLNRVLGGSPSSILGSLSANGQVFLVNPNGVYFGPGASIDVAGLVATTLEIGNSDFMAGRHVFTRPDGAPARAEVINQGVIAAREGGYVVLAGDYAANSGVIQARLGTVALAAGNKLTLDLAGDHLVSFAVDEKTVAGLAGVANTGQLLADGGRVFMTAKVGGDLAAMVVNNEGLVQARSTVERNGEIYLAADGGGVRVAGTLDASAQPGADGGKVSVVSRGGGDTVLAGGSLIRVSGSDLAVSDAGRVYTWADGATRFEKGAAIEARGGANGGDGGFVEVSGNRVVYRGLVDARAPHGKRGTLLIDPNEIVIAQGAGVDGSAGSVNTIYEQNLETTLQAGAADVVLEATGADAKITVADLSASGGDGILEGRNGGNTGGGLQLKVNGSGAPEIRFTNTSNTIAVDGELFLGRTSGGAIAPNITVGNLVAKNITIGNSGSPVAAVSVGALTATPKGSGDTSTTNINITAAGNIVLNGPVSVRANGSSSSGAYLNVRATGGNITHATGSANAIVVGNGSDSAGASARFTASNGTVSMGHVSVLSGGRAASIRIDGNQGVTLAGPITVQGLGSSSSGADLEVRANNGNISHTGGLISVTNTSPGSNGVAKACFVAGGGSCSGSGGSGSTRTITLGKVTVSASGSSGRALIGVNATGGISLNDDVTAQGGYSGAIAVSTWNTSAAIALAANKTIKATGSSGGAYVTVRANSNGTVNLSGALVAYASNSAAYIDVGGGTVTVGAVTAGNASPPGPGHRSYVNIQSQSGDVTLNGPITLTANSNSGSAAQLYVRSANNLDHVAGPATAISVRNYNPGNGGASASFQAVGTAAMGQMNVRGYEGAKIEVRGGTGISLADDLTATADGGGALINLRRSSGSTASIPISLATGKSIRAIATGSPGGGVYVDINGGGGTITLNGTVTASGGSGASSGRASIIVSGGDVTVGAMTATAGSSAQISVAGTNITLGGNLTAANSIQLSPNYGGGGNIVGNAYSLLTDQLLVRGTLATGTYSVTTNAATLDIQGGNAITVNAAAQAGTLTALLGGSGSQAVGDVAITAGGALDITRFWTTGTTHLLRADTLTLPGSITMPAAASVALKPYTLSNTVGFYSATDADATIQTNYDPSSWGVLFPAGATFTIGGITGGQQTGDIHVGADGAVDLGDKNIVFSTTGQVVSHTTPTTSGTVTVVAAAAAAAAASTTGGQVDDVRETMTAFASGLDHSSGGDAAENNGAGRSLTSLFAPGGAGPRLAPPPYEIRGGVNIGGAPPGPGDEGGGKGSRSGP